MPSSPTPLLNVEQQAAGENLNVWGQPHLNDALARLTEAIAATTPISSYPITLTSTNYVANQARNMILSCTGAGGVVTIPSQSKLYIVRNASSGNVTITTGAGVTAVVAAGDTLPVICDGTNCRSAGRLDFQNSVIRNLADGVNPQDAANKRQLDATLAAAQAYTDATAFASASLPGQAGQAGKYLTTDGATTSWGSPLPPITGTNGYGLFSNGVTPLWVAPVECRTLLGLGNSATRNVGTTAGTVAAGDDSRIVGAAQLTGAVFSGAISATSVASASFLGGVFSGSLSGNASTASRWITPRNLSLTGDGTATLTSVDGAANVSAALTLANSGVTAGTYGRVTVDAKGRVTAGLTEAGRIYAQGVFTGSTGATVVASGISLSRASTGVYAGTISPAAPDANYVIIASPVGGVATAYMPHFTVVAATEFFVSFAYNAGGVTTAYDPATLRIVIIV